MAQTNGELLKATQKLTKEVSDLSGRLTAKELLHKRTRMLGWVAIAIAILSVIGVGLAIATAFENNENAKQACLDTNEVRQAQRDLWGYILEASTQDPENTADDMMRIRAMVTYTDEVFAARDCENLSKNHNLPEPPPVPQ